MIRNPRPTIDFSVNTGEWVYNSDLSQVCQVIDVRSLWGETTYLVRLAGDNSVVEVSPDHLLPIERTPTSARHISYIVAAARVADALTREALLAPVESSVVPLPHQVYALARAVATDKVRYLLADEVGLGKTIEAGLILRELKLRGIVRRTLVVVPRGLVTQWMSEMEVHFGESFRLIDPSHIGSYRRLLGAENVWRAFPQIICPLDSIKPLHSRRGRTSEQVEAHNRERFADLVSAGWDLVIVDEAHRLGGSTEQVARYRLGKGLADATPHLLLLSATPHQGKTDAFHRLLSLIDGRQFTDLSAVTRDRVWPYVIRTEKRHAIDADGNPLFKARRTEMCAVSWQPRHRNQEVLYEAVSDYVREGYNQATREKRNYVGFLMVLLQRLVVSSTSAIHATLEKRLEVLGTSEEQLTLFPPGADEWSDMDGQEQLETMLRVQMQALRNERDEVKLLLETAARCKQGGPDAKAEALLDWLYRLQAEEGDPELKVLVFTEFVPTQQMLHRFLTDRGFTVVCLNGSMDMEERRRVQDAFARDVRILVSTDAGGEGLNLQFCHVVINYDIPWNPMRLEQRIGRVDRIGQSHVVRAVNFVFEGSVEKRVREVLEEKLAVIFEEFGIDKTSDVLDSSQAQQVFDKAFISAILNPDKMEDSVAEALAKLRGEAHQAHENMSVLGPAEVLQPGEAQRLRAHPLPHWVERMTVSYLAAQDRHAERTPRGWELAWPDRHIDTDVVFTSREAAQIPGSRHITIEDPRVRYIMTRLTQFVPGQPMSEVIIPELSAKITGSWSLWRISIRTSDDERVNIFPLFLSDDGRVLAPTARHIWDLLLDCDTLSLGSLDGASSHSAVEHLRAIAETEGKAVYDTLMKEHVSDLARERDKAQFAFSARRRAIEQIGLSQVRDHRLQVLAKEEEDFYEGMTKRSQALPHLEPLIVIRVRGEK